MIVTDHSMIVIGMRKEIIVLNTVTPLRMTEKLPMKHAVVVVVDSQARQHHLRPRYQLNLPHLDLLHLRPTHQLHHLRPRYQLHLPHLNLLLMMTMTPMTMMLTTMTMMLHLPIGLSLMKLDLKTIPLARSQILVTSTSKIIQMQVMKDLLSYVSKRLVRPKLIGSMTYLSIQNLR